MIKAVLDTNVLVSALIMRGHDGISDQIIRRVEAFWLILSEEILTEVNEVLRYDRLFKKYHLTEEIIRAYLLYLRQIGTVLVDLPKVKAIKDDPSDNRILACALAARAKYIVSGDTHLKDLRVFRGIKIMTPAQFLAELRGL